MARIRMRLALTPQDLDDLPPCRTITTDDREAIATLMWEAYRGTIDDEGETLDDARMEVEGTFGAKNGPLLMDCSFLIEEDDQVIAAALVTRYEKQQEPLLAFLMTHPSYKNRGLGTMLVTQTINALIARGYTALSLVVTEGNAPARHLYEKLGFQVEEPFPRS